MKKQLIFILAVILMMAYVKSTMIPHLGKPKGETPPTFKLDLDLPPKQRWQAMAKHYQVYLLETLVIADYYINLLPGHMKKIFLAADVWAHTTFQYKDMVQEIQGIAEVTNIPFAKLFFINLIYEFTTIKACSSIIVRNETGDVLHGRNMDFEFFDRFSRLSAQVQVFKGGKYIYTLDAYVGSVFALTGFKPNAFSITVDTRANLEENFMDVLANLIEKNYIPSVWLVRKVFEEETTWEGAVNRLNNTNITASVYYICAGVGKNEGAVMARKSGFGTHEYRTLTDDTWYLVQTNYDTDQKEPWYDQRKEPATKRIEAIGKKLTIDDLYQKVMTQWPTFNIGSIITFSSIPGRNYHNLTAWYGVNNMPNRTQSEENKIQQL